MDKPKKLPPEKPYVQSTMIKWFHPLILLNAAIKAVVAGTFGNYADRREIEAAIHDSADEQKEWEEVNHQYSLREEIWIDFISDTGDGFNSTYSVAVTVAQPDLTVTIREEPKKLPRGKILCFGGDQIYSTPTAEVYEQKFRVPFRAALPLNEKDEDRPHLYAIPGNHDWYDGLGNFIKVFCQRRWIGNWMTKQHRSYFVLQLPHHHWIWATDVQLNADIDQPQLDYFLRVAKEKMRDGDKVILITAEPAWVYKQFHQMDKSYDRLKFFTEVYITHDKYKIVGKKFELVATLTGDLHHYSHYCKKQDDGTQKNHFITAGGGGAFTHVTHNLPESLSNLNIGDAMKDAANLELQTRFPSKEESQKLVAGNLLFPFNNFSFAAFMGCIYLLIAWVSASMVHMLSENTSLANSVISIHSLRDLVALAKLFLYAPPVIILVLLFFTGIFKLTDTRSGMRGILWVGILHAVVQLTVLLLLLRLFAKLNTQVLNLKAESIFQVLLYMIECIFIGGFAGSFILGCYLYFCNRFLNIHIDEASSSLSGEDFKNFLRIHVAKEGITIYPIGIRHVLKNWMQEGSGDKIHFTPRSGPNKIPDYHLIHSPIFIKNQQP